LSLDMAEPPKLVEEHPVIAVVAAPVYQGRRFGGTEYREPPARGRLRRNGPSYGYGDSALNSSSSFHRDWETLSQRWPALRKRGGSAPIAYSELARHGRFELWAQWAFCSHSVRKARKAGRP
jgi:hypothetical protein